RSATSVLVRAWRAGERRAARACHRCASFPGRQRGPGDRPYRVFVLFVWTALGNRLEDLRFSVRPAISSWPPQSPKRQRLPARSGARLHAHFFALQRPPSAGISPFPELLVNHKSITQPHSERQFPAGDPLLKVLLRSG